MVRSDQLAGGVVPAMPLQTLVEHHRRIVAGIGEIRRHCAEGCVDGLGLDAARSYLTAASRERSTFVADVVVPALLKQAGEAQRDEMSNMLCICAAKRRLSNEHIAAWTPKTIAQDPAGYCSAAHTILAMLEEQMELEWRAFSSYLKNSSEAAGGSRFSRSAPGP